MRRSGQGATAVAALRRDRQAPPRFGALTEALLETGPPEPDVALREAHLKIPNVVHPDVPAVPNVGYLVGGRLFHPGDALTLPGEPLYKELAGGFNVAIAASPAAIVEARDAQDVVAAVRFAAATRRPIAPRSPPITW